MTDGLGRIPIPEPSALQIVHVRYGPRGSRHLAIDVRTLGFLDGREFLADPECVRFVKAEIARAEGERK